MEDFSGHAELIVFADAYAKFQQLLQPDSLVMVIGRGEVNDPQNGGVLKILVNEVFPMERVREKFTKSIILSINVNDIHENTIIELRKLLEGNKGSCACYFDVIQNERHRKYQTRKFFVEPTDELLNALKGILGPESVKLMSN
jgi:DNA polymerase-3 subunit alpha